MELRSPEEVVKARVKAKLEIAIAAIDGHYVGSPLLLNKEFLTREEVNTPVHDQLLEALRNKGWNLDRDYFHGWKLLAL